MPESNTPMGSDVSRAGGFVLDELSEVMSAGAGNEARAF